MKASNEMKLTFVSRSCNEAFARTAVAAFLASLDPTVDEMADIKTAVSEAVTNCIVHGYRDTLGMVYITMRLYENALVEIKIRDTGCGIEDVSQAMEPMFTTCTTGERAGLGFAVMESFMDKVRVRSKVGRGTTVTLRKTIRSRGESLCQPKADR